MMGRPLSRWWQRPELWLVAGAAVFLAGVVALMVAAYPSTDIAWLIHFTERVLGGATLYVDIIENRPPALFLLAVPPVAVGRLIGIDPTHAYHVWISGFILVSLMLCRAISRDAVFEQRPVTRRAFLLSGVVLLTVVPLHHYGQPGHVVTVLMLPYLLSAARRAAGRGISIRLAILAGLLAGAGIALKPFFVIPWLCVELFIRIRTRQPRSLMAPENICIAAIQAVFLGTVFIGFTAYITSVLPLAIELFNAHNIPLVILLMHALYGGLILAIPLLLGLGRHAVPGALSGTLFVAAGAFMVVFLIQLKGWGQHLLPSLTFSFLLCTILIVGYWESSRNSEQRVRGRPLLILLLAVVICYPVGLGIGSPIFPPTFFVRIDNPGYRAVLNDLSTIVQREAAGKPIFVLSASSYPGFHLISRGRAQWPYRFWSLWPLPGLYRDPDPVTRKHAYRSLDSSQAPERFVFDAVVSDFVRNPPHIVIVDAGSPKHGWIQREGSGGFDYLAYFGRDPRFASAFQTYEELPPIARFRIFRRH